MGSYMGMLGPSYPLFRYLDPRGESFGVRGGVRPVVVQPYGSKESNSGA